MGRNALWQPHGLHAGPLRWRQRPDAPRSPCARGIGARTLPLPPGLTPSPLLGARVGPGADLLLHGRDRRGAGEGEADLGAAPEAAAGLARLALQLHEHLL